MTKRRQSKLYYAILRFTFVIPFNFCRKKLIREDTRSWCPMRRSGEPLELSKVVAFLVSDDNLFMTGANVVVDGGLVLENRIP